MGDKSGLFLHYWKLLHRERVEPIPEYHFYPTRRWRFDWAFPDKKIAIEVEGNAWNVKGGGRHMQDSDMEKYNHAALLGWRVFRFSPGMIERNPIACVEMIDAVLG